MLALPPNAAAGKLWFERVPVRTRQITVVVAAGIIALIILSLVGCWYHCSQPAYVVEVFDRINAPADLEAQSKYFTPKGKAVVLWVMQKHGDKPASSEKLVYSAPIISGNTCDVPVRQGAVTGAVRLVKTDHWRFDDLYVDKAGDKSIQLWASYMKDHPIGAWWSMHGDEMFGAFCKGVFIGASVAR